MDLSFDDFVNGPSASQHLPEFKEQEEEEQQAVTPTQKSQDFRNFIGADKPAPAPPVPTLKPDPEEPDETLVVPEDPSGLSPEVLDLVDQAYDRTFDYMYEYFNPEQVKSLQEVMAKERKVQEDIFNRYIKGQNITREQGLKLLRERNPNSILLKSDTDAALEALNSFAGEAPDKQREKMISLLQSENVVTRKAAEMALRNMSDSTLGAMNTVVDIDSFVNPITIAADVPVFLGDAVDSGKEAVAAAKEGRYKDAGLSAGGAVVNTAFGFMSAVPALSTGKSLYKGAKALKKTPEEQLALANRYNPGGARLATMEAAEQARKRADEVAAQNDDMVQEFIDAIETKWETTISKEVGGRRVVDFDKAKQVGQEIATEITERDGVLFDLALGDDMLTTPILNPNKFNPLVAAAVDLKKAHPEYFGKADTVIEDLFNLTTKGELRLTEEFAEEFIDTLNKYGLSYEDYVLVAAGSASRAGQVLQSFSQIGRFKPESVRRADIEKRKV